MKGFIWAAIIVAVAAGVWHFRSQQAPSTRQVEAALRDYLSSAESNHCSGSMTIEQLDSVSVGDYSKEFGGWPVYAAHAETCHESGNSSGYSSTSSSTYDGRNNARRKVAAAFVRRSPSGGVEIFTPALFKNGQAEMQQTFQKAFDNIQIKSN